MKKKSSKKNYWVRHVQETSFAMRLPEGIFTWSSPKRIARGLKQSALESSRTKGTKFQSAMSMLNYYINRAGKNLKPERRKILEAAKVELRNLMKKIIILTLFTNLAVARQTELPEKNQLPEQTKPGQTRQLDCLFATAQVDQFTQTISAPGTYCLIEDFIVAQGRPAGFIITSDDVLLDLNGHVLNGALSNNSVGIIIRPANNITAPRNITVRNGTLAFMRTAGVLVNTAFGVQIDSIFFLSDATGILANNMTRSQISNCFLTLATNSGITFNNAAGSSSQSVTITNCVSYNNTVNGFSLNNCLNFQLFNCIATGNGVNGFAQTLSNQCDYQECIANTNGNNGFFITGNSNSLEQCQAKGNGAAGFIFAAPSTQGQVRDNIATANAVGFQNNGATVPAVNANRFYANFANSNGPTGVTNFVNIANFFPSPIPADAINFTTNISN